MYTIHPVNSGSQLAVALIEKMPFLAQLYELSIGYEFDLRMESDHRGRIMRCILEKA